MSRRVRPPAPPYLGPPAHYSAGVNKPIHRIVIHSAVVPCQPGMARAVARMFREGAVEGSAHYCTDPGETVQAAWDSVICWHAPPNPNSLGIEMADTPGPVPDDRPGSARWRSLRRSWRWIKPEQRAMLRRTATLTAQLALAYGVPIRFLSPRKLAAGEHGITTHANVSKAFRQSVHWDPGWWPRRRFMRLVRKAAADIRKGTT